MKAVEDDRSSDLATLVGESGIHPAREHATIGEKELADTSPGT
jgi:hypothetical protein